jgi:ribonuclease G
MASYTTSGPKKNLRLLSQAVAVSAQPSEAILVIVQSAGAVLPMTEFGLVQITRQRVRQNILHSFSEPCPACGGTGLVQSKTTTVNQLERWVARFKGETGEKRLIIRVNPELALILRSGTMSILRKMMLKHFLMIRVVPDSAVAIGAFRCFSPKQGDEEITDQYK